MPPTVFDTQAIVPAALPMDDADAEDARYLRAIRSKQADALARSQASINPHVEAVTHKKATDEKRD